MDSNPLHPHVIPLYGSTTHHPWGSRSPTSQPARLQALNRFGPIHPDKPYSEFVISTHPTHAIAVLASAPSVSLRDHIDTQIIEVDPTMVEFYSRLHSHGIPYILKIVSVDAPQPLRVNPLEKMLKRLADEQPPLCTDQVAKALMIIALTKVDMLLGFQSAGDIVGQLSRVPEFADAVGRPETDHFVHVVKTGAVKPADVKVICTHLLGRKREFISKCLKATTERFLKMPEDAVTESDRQLLALHKLHPDDPVCFAVYFLNHVVLEPENAVFVHPQKPHTVLSGEFVEASTSSESSILAGLSDQPVHVQTFLDCLSFGGSSVQISSGDRFSEYGVSYIPPVPQFHLLQFKLPPELSQQMLETMAPSVILVLEGEGHIKVDTHAPLLPLHAGSVYYLNPQTQFVVTAIGREDSLLHFIQIGVNESAAPSMASSCVIV